MRALAFKWIRIIYRCWKEQVAYDENVYLAALAKHNSPLVAATKGRWRREKCVEKPWRRR